MSVPAVSSARPRAAASRKSLSTTSTSTSVAPTRKVAATTTTKSTAWSTSEVMALYAAQGRADISAPDFWELVAEGVAEVGFDRTAEECQQQWFVVCFFLLVLLYLLSFVLLNKVALPASSLIL